MSHEDGNEPIVRAYIRTSTHRQNTDVQKIRTSQYAEDQGWEIEYYFDLGKSGALPWNKRPGLKRLIDEIQAGDELVCVDQSRLTRGGLSHLYEIKGILKKKGVNFIDLDLISMSMKEKSDMMEVINLIRNWQ